MSKGQCRTTVMHEESEMIVFQPMSLFTAKAPSVSLEAFYWRFLTQSGSTMEVSVRLRGCRYLPLRIRLVQRMP